MSYFAEPNYIEYDAWFDENIEPLDLAEYVNEKKFCNSIHHKFFGISKRNIIIGSSENIK